MLSLTPTFRSVSRSQVRARRLVDEYRGRRVDGVAAERVAIGQRYRHRRIDHAVDLEQLLPHRLLQAEDVQRLLLGGRGGKALALEDLAHRERFPARQPPGLQDGHRPREVALRSEEHTSELPSLMRT